MKTKNLLVIGMLLGIFSGFASAGTTGDYSVTLSIGNGAPTVDSINMIDPTALPTQNAVTTVYASFIAQDPNGQVDLNTTSAQCSLHNTATEASTSCSKAVISVTQANYTCGIDMKYYDPTSVYALTCQIHDMAGGSDQMTNNTAFSYGTLTAIALSRSTLDFTELSIGSVVSASEYIDVLNQGNVQITNVSVKGYDLSDLSSNILGVGNFNMTADNHAGTGVPVVNDTYEQIPAMTVTVGSGASTSTYLWVHVPIGTVAGQYTSVANWILAANP